MKLNPKRLVLQARRTGKTEMVHVELLKRFGCHELARLFILARYDKLCLASKKRTYNVVGEKNAQRDGFAWKIDRAGAFQVERTGYEEAMRRRAMAEHQRLYLGTFISTEDGETNDG